MQDDFEGAPSAEIRAMSAAVNYDGSLAVMLAVPGHDELVSHAIPGNEHTLLLNWDESHAMPIDMDGVAAVDRRCQELVARGVARLNDDLERERVRQARLRREHLAREDERDV